MSKDKIGAYQQQQKRNLTPREVEAMAFTKAALLLEEAKGKVKNLDEFAKALRFNHLLWTIIQADLTDPANQLPDEIKANVMSLSIFVDKQTTKALRSSEPRELDILITINRNLAAGLRTNAGTAQAGVAAAAEPPPPSRAESA
jgi:flagellar protein FlaF